MQEALIARFRQLYGTAPEFITRAPGRIEFIGNHTDYNGGTVLGAAIDRGVWVGLRRRADRAWRFASGPEGSTWTVPAGPPGRQAGAGAWLNYPLGVIAGLPHFGLTAPGGFDYLAMSDLPPGAGLSSSAAIELASALALLAATDQQLPRESLVKLARHAENEFVGVPCGILDQGVSGFGRKDHLVFIDCRGPLGSSSGSSTRTPSTRWWTGSTRSATANASPPPARSACRCWPTPPPRSWPPPGASSRP